MFMFMFCAASLVPGEYDRMQVCLFHKFHLLLFFIKKKTRAVVCYTVGRRFDDVSARASRGATAARRSWRDCHVSFVRRRRFADALVVDVGDRRSGRVDLGTRETSLSFYRLCAVVLFLKSDLLTRRSYCRSVVSPSFRCSRMS